MTLEFTYPQEARHEGIREGLGFRVVLSPII